MKKLCSVKGCGRQLLARKLCAGHYNRFMKTGDVDEKTPIEARQTNVGRACSVKGCEREATAKGKCKMHARRVRENGEAGVADSLRSDPVEQLRYLKEVVLKHTKKKACLIWPYSSTGYALVRYKGKRQSANRIVCSKVNGPPPSPKHQACHTCGKGDEGCINPHHLYWGTPKQNQADRKEHGTHIAGELCHLSKLAEFSVRKILKEIAAGKPLREIADKFNVTYRNVYAIHRGDTWKHIER